MNEEKVKYKISIKPPSGRATIWAGLGRQKDTLPSQESEKHRTKRENVAHRIETLSGEKPEWNKRTFAYTSVLTEEQATELAKMEMVRRVERV